MKKKLLVAVLCVVMMAVGGLATWAYFTDQDAVTNTFTVGEIQILLDETDTDDSETDVTPGTDPVRDKENAYDDIIPGHTYVKDPQVTVLANSEDCYVRVQVTINNQRELDDLFAPVGGYDLENFIGGYDKTAWQLVSETESGDTRTYTFNYIGGEKGVVKKAAEDNALTKVFTSVKVPGAVIDPETGEVLLNIGNEEIKAFDNLEIKVIAHAIQADGFASADEAWTAFDKIKK